jgi:hypothetical protein
VTLGWLWPDRLPVENDPAVAARATIDGLGDSSVEAIDVMTKESQQLAMSAVNGSHAITDLLVEDYPTFPPDRGPVSCSRAACASRATPRRLAYSAPIA